MRFSSSPLCSRMGGEFENAGGAGASWEEGRFGQGHGVTFHQTSLQTAGGIAGGLSHFRLSQSWRLGYILTKYLHFLAAWCWGSWQCGEDESLQAASQLYTNQHCRCFSAPGASTGRGELPEILWSQALKGRNLPTLHTTFLFPWRMGGMQKGWGEQEFRQVLVLSKGTMDENRHRNTGVWRPFLLPHQILCFCLYWSLH